MTSSDGQGGIALLWIGLFVAASTATAIVLGCATPFVALAALAATHLRRRDGAALIVAAWVASEIVAIAVHHYPLTGWAPALATAALAATVAAYAAVAGMPRAPGAARLAIAYVAGFAIFKAAVALWSIPLGGGHMALALDVMVRQFVRDGLILIGLAILARALVAAGLPAAPRATTAAA